MNIITFAVLAAYVLLILISIFLDPKRGKTKSRFTRSIMHILLFSTLKMLVAISIVVIVSVLLDISLLKALGFSSFSLSWQVLGYGIVTAFGFVVIYILWQMIALRFPMKKIQSERNESNMIDLLPDKWLPLISIFVIISFEAGLLEEVFFRGIMQFNFSNYVAIHWAVIISGMFFGLAHYYQGVSGITGTSLLGIWLGSAFVLTGNILVPILGHFLGDFACMMLSSKQIMKQKKNL